jgi:hypothetical protein
MTPRQLLRTIGAPATCDKHLRGLHLIQYVAEHGRPQQKNKDRASEEEQREPGYGK